MQGGPQTRGPKEMPSHNFQCATVRDGKYCDFSKISIFYIYTYIYQYYIMPTLETVACFVTFYPYAQILQNTVGLFFPDTAKK